MFAWSLTGDAVGWAQFSISSNASGIDPLETVRFFRGLPKRSPKLLIGSIADRCDYYRSQRARKNRREGAGGMLLVTLKEPEVTVLVRTAAQLFDARVEL